MVNRAETGIGITDQHHQPGVFLETLPSDCPPQAAEGIDRPMVVYRLVTSDPPTMEDFRSKNDKNPNNPFVADKCKASGLSVFEKKSDVKKKMRRRDSKIWRFTLQNGDGIIIRDKKSSHCTWWPYANWNKLRDGQVVSP